MNGKIWVIPFALLLIVPVGSAILGVDAAAGSDTISGEITSNTTWTKAHGPYFLSGVVTVSKGVTLTIEPGVNVNANTWSYLVVNGTLHAVGTSTDLIYFNSGLVEFTESSPAWDEQTGSGCIIEYAVVGVVYVYGASPKISHNSIYSQGIITDEGSPIISYNSIASAVVNDAVLNLAGGSPQILYNNIVGQIYVQYGSPTITGNSVTSESYLFVDDPYFDHPLLPPGYVGASHLGTTVSGIVIGGKDGIQMTGWNWVYKLDHAYNAVVTDNTIYGALTYEYGNQYGIWTGPEGTATVERNQIYNCTTGIQVEGAATIQANTLTGNDKAITVNSTKQVVITQNNLQNNNQTLLTLALGAVDLTNNWWGTTNTQGIREMVPSTLSYEPFLTLANPNAYPVPHESAVPYVTSNPQQTYLPTSSPTEAPANRDPTNQSNGYVDKQGNNPLNLFSAGTENLILAGIAVIIILLIVLIILTLRKKS